MLNIKITKFIFKNLLCFLKISEFFYIILFKKPVPLSAWLIQTQYILGEIISTNDDCKVIKDSFFCK